MRVKRLVSLALAGMLAASVALTGCGSKKEATTSDGKTIVKIGTQQISILLSSNFLKRKEIY